MPSRRPTEVPRREWKVIAHRYDIDGFRVTITAGPPVVEGFAPCYRSKKQAAQAVAQLLGIAAVINRLRVVPNAAHGDSELASAVEAALAALPGAPFGVTLSVRDGVVTVRGRVLSHAERCQIEAAVWQVGGVQDVDSRLEVGTSGPATNGRRVSADIARSA